MVITIMTIIDKLVKNACKLKIKQLRKMEKIMRLNSDRNKLP